MSLGPRHFQEGVLLELRREALVSFFYLLSIALPGYVEHIAFL